MKKNFFTIMLFSSLLLSCGGQKKEDLRSNSLDLTITADAGQTLDDNDTGAGKYTDFKIGKRRFLIEEIEEKATPSNLEMLVEALGRDADVKSQTDKKELKNGSFGVLYETTSDEKKFVFYFQKENRYYRITPIFNSEGENFAEAIEAIGTLK